MDKGAFIERGYTVEPGDGGTFVVWEGGRLSNQSSIRHVRGFTSWRDLMDWLVQEHRANEATPNQTGEVDRT